MRVASELAWRVGAFLAIAGLMLSAADASGQGRQTKVALRADGGAYAITSVRVNGAGPYDFMVDTGSSLTMIDASLASELNLRPEGVTSLTSIAAEGRQATSHATVAVGTIAVTGLRLALVSGMERRPLGREIRGVLGENFLSMFDVLLDNEHRSLTLDPDGILTATTDGERLPMNMTTRLGAQVVPLRPTVLVVVPGYNTHPLRLILDSGTPTLLIVRRALPFHSDIATNGGENEAVLVKTPNGVLECAGWREKIKWGGAAFGNVQVTSCATALELDAEGSMPTSLFRQVLISHKGGYVIVNPRVRAPGPALQISAATGASP